MEYSIVKNKLILFGLILFCNYLVYARVVEPEEYLKNVARRMVLEMQEREITGNGFPIQDFDVPMNMSRYGKPVNGTVRFFSGFVASIEAIRIIETTFSTPLFDTHTEIRAELGLYGVRVVFDIDFDLTTFRGKGTLTARFAEIRYRMGVLQNFTDFSLFHDISYLSAGSIYTTEVNIYPFNPEAQIVARQVRTTPAYRDFVVNSFPDWNPTWMNCMTIAVSVIEFPEILYI